MQRKTRLTIFCTLVAAIISTAAIAYGAQSLINSKVISTNSISVGNLVATALNANSYDVGDFTISSNEVLTSGTDYTFKQNDVPGKSYLVIKTIKNITIANKNPASPTEQRINIECPQENANCNVTLAGVNIKTPYGDGINTPDDSDFKFTLTLHLASNTKNYAISTQASKPGIRKTGERSAGWLIITADDDSGYLYAEGGIGAAGIGGKGAGEGFDYEHDSSKIRIDGGTVEAHGANDPANTCAGAGIGAGGGGNARDIVVNGGHVMAFGGQRGAAGIGAGEEKKNESCYCDTLTFNGGRVYAVGGGDGGAGIGAGPLNSASGIKINGGVIIASGGSLAAGIGGGRDHGEGDDGKSEDNILNGDAIVIASSGGKYSSFGTHGHEGLSGFKRIRGLVFERKSQTKSVDAFNENPNYTSFSGNFYDSENKGVSAVYDCTIPCNFEIPSGKTLGVKAGVTLDIPNGYTLTNSGNFNILSGGTFKAAGTLVNGLNSTINNSGTLQIQGVLSNQGTLHNTAAANEGILSYGEFDNLGTIDGGSTIYLGENSLANNSGTISGNGSITTLTTLTNQNTISEDINISCVSAGKVVVPVKLDACAGTVGGKASIDKNVIYQDASGVLSYDLPTAVRTHYNFGGWFTEKDGKGEELTIAPVKRNLHNLYASWAPRIYKIDLRKDEVGGSVSIKNADGLETLTQFSEGTKADFAISVNDGYKIDSFTVDGKDYTSQLVSGRWTLNSVEHDSIVYVRFKKLPTPKVMHTITIVKTDAPDDAVVVAPSEVEDGKSIVLTAIGTANKKVSTVTYGEPTTSVTLKNHQATISNITQDITITVTFVDGSDLDGDVHSVTPSSKDGSDGESHGTTLPSTAVGVTDTNEGSDVVITVVPDAGYEVDKVETLTGGQTSGQGTDVTDKYDPISGTVTIPADSGSLNADTKVEVTYIQSYTYDEQSKTLTVMTDEGTTAWRDADPRIPLDAVEHLVIRDGVENIGDRAFAGCSELVDIKGAHAVPGGIDTNADKTDGIPDSVTHIGYEAFEGCTKLEHAQFGDNSALEEIGEGAFHNTGLVEIIIPGSVKEIGKDAFTDDDSLDKIGFASGDLSGTTIDDGAFDMEINKDKIAGHSMSKLFLTDASFVMSSNDSRELLKSLVYKWYYEGDSVKIKAASKAGYAFANFAVKDGSPSVTFNYDATDASIATFEMPNTSLTVLSEYSESPRWAATIKNQHIIVPAKEIGYTVGADDGFTVTVTNTGNQPLQFEEPSFIDTPSARALAFEATSVNPGTLNAGESATFTVKAVAGLGLGIYTNKVHIVAKPTQSDAQVDDVVIDVPVTFTVANRIVNISGEVKPGDDGQTHGAISPTDTAVGEGGDVVLDVIPDDGYVVDKVVVDKGDGKGPQEQESISNTIPIDGVTDDTKVEVTFKPIEEDVYYSATIDENNLENCTVSPMNVTIQMGESQHYTITPAVDPATGEAYVIDKLIINGVDVTYLVSNNAFDLSSFSNDYNIVIKYKKAGSDVPDKPVNPTPGPSSDDDSSDTPQAPSILPSNGILSATGDNIYVMVITGALIMIVSLASVAIYLRKRRS